MSAQDRSAATVIEGLLRRLYEFNADDHPAEEAARAWLAENKPTAAIVDALRAVAAAAWGYRVFYEAYWGEDVPGSPLPVEQKQRMLSALVYWQQELDAALDALDDDPGDFASAKAAHRATIANAIREARDAAE